MQLKTVKSEVIQHKTIPGLVTGDVILEVKSGKSNLKWDGPKIPLNVWWSILAYFKAVFDTTHSECQVRLYCNPRLKTWAAWAYPQEARSYMSAREIDNDDARAQREQFKDSEGWLYLGTVHHHCSTSAFQSGTDQHNERNQDGLHITVGNLNKEVYDLHARFYVDGCEFTPDMTAFWDIGAYLKLQGLPEDVCDQLGLPDSIREVIARTQMCQPPPQEQDFPDQWAKNLIEIKSFPAGGVSIGGSFAPGSMNGSVELDPIIRRRENALAEVRSKARAEGITEFEIDATFEVFCDEDVGKYIRLAAAHHNVGIEDVIMEWEWSRNNRKWEAERNAKNPTGKPELPGAPDQTIAGNVDAWEMGYGE